MAKPPPSRAVNFSVWTLDGSAMPDKVRRAIEEALERAVLEQFNQGHRLLTQTVYARG
jgi:hypothetical protein